MLQNISGLSGANNAIEQPKTRVRPPRQSSDGAAPDRLELSDEALRLTAGEHPANQRLERVRREIAAGTYETDHKLDTTIDRLFADLSAFELQA